MNGKAQPELTIAAGQIERWRIVNASSARYVRLSIGGAPYRILGTDGSLVEEPITATEVLLSPADRIEPAVGPVAEGQILAVEALLPHYHPPAEDRAFCESTGQVRKTLHRGDS